MNILHVQSLGDRWRINKKETVLKYPSELIKGAKEDGIKVVVRQFGPHTGE